jgi:putative ABC transport system ATP-binding protein
VVFQNESLVPNLTAEENVALPLAFRGLERRAARDLACRALTRLGLERLAESYPDELSAGQSQRVAVARVLAAEPRLILADEPTGRLDRTAGRRVLEALVEVADEVRAALVVATHDQEAVRRLPTRWRLRDGALEVLATPTGEVGSR